MSLTINLTNSKAAYGVDLGPDGQWRVTAVAKATFGWNQAGMVHPVAGPALLSLDEFAGDPAASGLLRASDLGPPKPKLDVLLIGAMVFPRPITEIDVALAVGTRLLKKCRVFGDRVWRQGMVADRVPSDPVPTHRVPIAWEKSYGGTDPENQSYVDHRNPAGSGHAKNPQTLLGRPAPNFEDPQKPIGALLGSPAPVGFGPIAAHWKQRTALAGTFDEAWATQRKPMPPKDFSAGFFNVAPIDQQLDGYLPGEEIRLVNLTTAGLDRFNLPAIHLPITFQTTLDHAEAMAEVDTVLIEPEERRFSLLAKAQAPLVSGPESLGRIVLGETTRGMRSAIQKGKHYRWPLYPQAEP